jgi:DNA-binding SARP family transcriptional activator
LRKALESDLPEKFPSRYLSVEQGEIRLHLPEGSHVDFEEFEQHIANQAWESALALYQGDLFPGDLYSDWAIDKREQLKQEAVRAALGTAQQAMQAGNPVKAFDACQRVLALEPWQEEAVLVGMQACVAQNDRAGAIRLYQKLARALREELDVAPQENVQAYYRSLISP